jgi:hypothetical protein
MKSNAFKGALQEDFFIPAFGYMASPVVSLTYAF